MEINQLTLEANDFLAADIEEYLNNSILNYGSQEINGEVPFKLCCSYRDEKHNLVGGVMGSVSRNMLFVSHLFVEEACRGNGIGHKLLNAIENIAKEHSVDLIRLNTLNSKAGGFYTKAGYEITTCIPAYINGFDLVYYHKTIN